MYKDIAEEVEEIKKEVSVVEKIKGDLLYQNIVRALQTICILWFISIVLIVGAFLLFLNQYDFTNTTETATEVSQDSGDNGINNYIGGSGEINNGKASD